MRKKKKKKKGAMPAGSCRPAPSGRLGRGGGRRPASPRRAALPGGAGRGKKRRRREEEGTLLPPQAERSGGSRSNLLPARRRETPSRGELTTRSSWRWRRSGTGGCLGSARRGSPRRLLGSQWQRRRKGGRVRGECRGAGTRPAASRPAAIALSSRRPPPPPPLGGPPSPHGGRLSPVPGHGLSPLGDPPVPSDSLVFPQNGHPPCPYQYPLPHTRHPAPRGTTGLSGRVFPSALGDPKGAESGMRPPASHYPWVKPRTAPGRSVPAVTGRYFLGTGVT